MSSRSALFSPFTYFTNPSLSPQPMSHGRERRYIRLCGTWLWSIIQWHAIVVQPLTHRGAGHWLNPLLLHYKYCLHWGSKGPYWVCCAEWLLSKHLKVLLGSWFALHIFTWRIKLNIARFQFFLVPYPFPSMLLHNMQRCKITYLQN